MENLHIITNFTIVCLVTWPLSGSEAGADPVLLYKENKHTIKTQSDIKAKMLVGSRNF